MKIFLRRNTFLVITVCMACIYLLNCGGDNISSNDYESDLRISIISGNNSIGTPNDLLNSDYIVRIADANNNAVSGVDVTFEIVLGDGSLNNTLTKTNVIGIAKTRLTAGAAGGISTAKATINNGQSVIFESFILNPIEIVSKSKGTNYIEILWTHKITDGFEDYSVYRRESNTYGDSLLVYKSSDSSFVDLHFDVENEYVYTIQANYPEYGSIRSRDYKTRGYLQVDFLSSPFDVEYDSTRQLMYVSLPDENSIAIISYPAWELVDKINVGMLPQGIDINFDCTKLFVALWTGGAVVSLDLNTYEFATIDVSQALSSTLTYDVVEALPNRVFVSGNANSDYYRIFVALIRTDEGNTVSRIPDSTQYQGRANFFNQRPIFPSNPNDSILYIYENGQYGKINLVDTNHSFEQRGAWFIQRRVVNQIEESPDGSRLYLPNGIIVGTGDMSLIMNLDDQGLSVLNRTGDRLFVGRNIGRYANGRVRDALGFIVSYNTQTFLPIDSLEIDIIDINRMEMMPGDSIIIFLMGDGVRGINIESIN